MSLFIQISPLLYQIRALIAQVYPREYFFFNCWCLPLCGTLDSGGRRTHHTVTGDEILRPLFGDAFCGSISGDAFCVPAVPSGGPDWLMLLLRRSVVAGLCLFCSTASLFVWGSFSQHLLFCAIYCTTIIYTSFTFSDWTSSFNIAVVFVTRVISLLLWIKQLLVSFVHKQYTIVIAPFSSVVWVLLFKFHFTHINGHPLDQALQYLEYSTKFHHQSQNNMTKLLVPNSGWVWKKFGGMMLWIMSGNFKDVKCGMKLQIIYQENETLSVMLLTMHECCSRI